MSTLTPTRVRTLIAQAPTRTVDAVPEGAPRAFLAGLEAAVFGWLCVVVPAVASYVATAAAPALGDATWLQAAATGSALWRLAHGGAASVSGAPVDLVPLGLSVLAAAIVAFSLQRARVLSWTGIIAATLGYATVALLLAVLTPGAAGGLGRTVLGSLLIGAAGAVIGVRRGLGSMPPLRPDVAGLVHRLPVALRSILAAGTRGAGLATAGLLGVGTVLVGVSLGVSHERFAESMALLRADGLGTVMILVACALVLPTVVVWAVSWVAGPGFAVGVGTTVTASEVVAGPLPTFPLTAGLPGTTPLAGATFLVVVGVGAAVGWHLHRRAPQTRWWASAGTGVAAGVGAGVVIALLGLAASGSVGPDRMSVLGPEPLGLAVLVAGQIALGAVVVVLALRPDTRALARRWAARGRNAVRHPLAGVRASRG